VAAHGGQREAKLAASARVRIDTLVMTVCLRVHEGGH
jgi:hypothetical protein